ncbi:MAG: sigma factor, partial [Acidimicrobiales bacterium]
MLEASDRAAFQQLASEQLAGLYALARRLAGRDAEDLVQEALLRACQSFSSLRDRQAGARWLRVILTNVWRDGLRRHGREPAEVPLDDTECFSLYRTLVEEDPFP